MYAIRSYYAALYYADRASENEATAQAAATRANVTLETAVANESEFNYFLRMNIPVITSYSIHYTKLYDLPMRVLLNR